MTQIDGLFETHLTVTNLDRSVAFYRDVVGLSLASTFPERRVAFFWVGGPGRAMLGLWESNDVLRLRLHFAFAVPLADLLAAPAALRKAGVTPCAPNLKESDEPSVYGWMPAAVVFFRDPDEHSIEYLSMLDMPPRPELRVVSWSQWNAQTAS
jgi:lactoylglutathione lyase